MQADPRRRRLLAAALLAAAVALALVTPTALRLARAARHEAAGRRALDDYDFDAARDEFARALAERPRHAGLHLLAAQAARRAGDYPAAARHLDAHRDLCGQLTPPETLERALLRAQQGELPEVDAYLKGVLDGPGGPEALVLEAVAHGCVRVYRSDEALRCADRLIEIDPGHAPARAVRGLLQESVAQDAAAVEDYRAAVAAHPRHRAARLQLAEALLRTGQPAEAREHFEALHARSPDDDTVSLGLAKACREMNDLERAESLLAPLQERRPGWGEVAAERGRVALQDGRAEAAEEQFRRAVAALPADRRAHQDFATALRLCGRDDEAARVRQRMEAIDADVKLLAVSARRAAESPRDPEPRYAAGAVCLRNGQVGQALRWFGGALQLAPDHKPTHAVLAEHFERVGRPELAARHRELAR